MSDKDLSSCGKYHAHLMRWNRRLQKRENILVHFGCGKKDCPKCAERKRKKLLKRLRQVKWNKQLYLWTITTDPKTIDPATARATINKRWHIVHRSIYRLTPKFHYFKVVELTKSGLPHIHFITDQWIDWKRFQKLLIKSRFGKVLHFSKIPVNQGVNYVCKYVSKHVYQPDVLEDLPSRLWGNSRGLLESTTYRVAEGKWEVAWISDSLAITEASYLNAEVYVHSPAHAPPDPVRSVA